MCIRDRCVDLRLLALCVLQHGTDQRLTGHILLEMCIRDREKDGVVFFPSGYGSSEQHSPSLFIISQYVQWNMIIFEGFAEELGFAGIYLQHNWDDLSKEETEGMISCGIVGDALTSHPNYVADRYRQTRVPLQSPQI